MSATPQTHSTPSSRSRNGTSPGETAVGVAILVLLAVILAGILIQQSRYDADYFQGVSAPAATSKGPEAGGESSVSSPGVASSTSSSDSSAAGSLIHPPVGFKVMSAPETFDRDTLSEKIDGKAELYLESGFIALATQRFESESTADLWFEVYRYDMGAPRNAFAVLSSQRRPQSPDSPLAPFAYSTENALFFLHGDRYYELVGSEASPALLAAMTETAEAILAPPPSGTLDLPELAFYPADGFQKSGLKLQLANGYGFSGFGGLTLAPYDVEGAALQAFVLLAPTPEDAARLAGEYEAMLLQAGAEKKAIETSPIPGLRVVDVLGDFELVFSRGRVVAGVHQATAMESALALALRLYTRIGEESQ